MNIPNSVTFIGEYAFYDCTGLSNLTIPNSITHVGLSAFENTEWFDNQPDDLIYIGLVAYKYKGSMQEGTSITIKEGTLEIADMAFYGCTGLKSINIGNSISSIGTRAFSGCTGLESIVIPNSVTSIGGSAFYGCTGLSRVTISNSVTTIGYNVFDGCSSLSNVAIPNTVTEIGSSAFRNCTSLTSIIIPNSVIIIHDSAFSGCTGLASITIGSSVSSIGDNAFITATSIEEIICFATTPPLWNGTDMFSVNVYNHAQLHVPISSVSAYKSDPNWGKFITIIGDISGDDPFDDPDYMKCDVNGDGEVNIADVNRIIDAILTH